MVFCAYHTLLMVHSFNMNDLNSRHMRPLSHQSWGPQRVRLISNWLQTPQTVKSVLMCRRFVNRSFSLCFEFSVQMDGGRLWHVASTFTLLLLPLLLCSSASSQVSSWFLQKHWNLIWPEADVWRRKHRCILLLLEKNHRTDMCFPSLYLDSAVQSWVGFLIFKPVKLSETHVCERNTIFSFFLYK